MTPDAGSQTTVFNLRRPQGGRRVVMKNAHVNLSGQSAVEFLANTIFLWKTFVFSKVIIRLLFVFRDGNDSYLMLNAAVRKVSIKVYWTIRKSPLGLIWGGGVG